MTGNTVLFALKILLLLFLVIVIIKERARWRASSLTAGEKILDAAKRGALFMLKSALTILLVWQLPSIIDGVDSELENAALRVACESKSGRLRTMALRSVAADSDQYVGLRIINFISRTENKEGNDQYIRSVLKLIRRFPERKELYTEYTVAKILDRRVEPANRRMLIELLERIRGESFDFPAPGDEGIDIGAHEGGMANILKWREKQRESMFAECAKTDWISKESGN